jgi:hypothetical protein
VADVADSRSANATISFFEVMVRTPLRLDVDRPEFGAQVDRSFLLRH